MRLYNDYCPRCPRPLVKHEGNTVRNGPPDPSKCHYCSCGTELKSALTAYVEAGRAIKKLNSELSEASRGVRYFDVKQKEFLGFVSREHVREGDLRVVKIGSVAVILDYRGSDLSISYAELERDY